MSCGLKSTGESEMPKKKKYGKAKNGLYNRISKKLFERPYGWLDAYEAQEVRDFIKYKMGKGKK